MQSLKTFLEYISVKVGRTEALPDFSHSPFQNLKNGQKCVKKKERRKIHLEKKVFTLVLRQIAFSLLRYLMQNKVLCL